MLIAALLALSPAAESPPSPELLQAGEAWPACLGEGMQDADSGTGAAARAEAILARCRPLQEAMMAAHGHWIDTSALSDREKANARRVLTRSLRGMRARLIGAFRND